VMAGGTPDSVQVLSVEEMAAIDPELTQAYQQAGIIPSKRMFGVNVELKTTTNFNRTIKLGASSPQQVDLFLSKQLDKNNPNLYPKFRDSMMINLGLNPLQVDNVSNIAKQLQETRRAFSSPIKAIVTTNQGTNIKSNVALMAIKLFKKEFNKSHTKNDIEQDSLKRSVYKILDKIEKKAEDYEDTFDRVSEILGRFIEIQRIGARSMDPDIRAYVASKIYSIAGAYTANVMDVRSLQTLESFSLDVNSSISDFLKGFLKDQKSQIFDLSVNPQGVRIKNKKDPNIYLDLVYNRRSSNRRQETINYVYTSKGFINYYSNNNALVREALLLL